MLRIAFESQADAKMSAELLVLAFSYHSVKTLCSGASCPTKVSLNEGKFFLALGLGYSSWEELLDSSNFKEVDIAPREPDYDSFAIQFERLMRIPGQFERIRKALHTSQVLDSAEMRGYAMAFLKNLPCEKEEQMGEILQIEAVYRYHSRYSHTRSVKQNEELMKWRNNAIAKVLGRSLVNH